MSRHRPHNRNLILFLCWFRHFRRHRPHHRRPHGVVLFVDGVGVVLNPTMESHIMVDVTAKHKVHNELQFFDADGNPMLVTPALDTPPAWTNTADPSVDALDVSADALVCDANTLAPGADVLTVSVVSNGSTFSASVTINIQAAEQVLTSVGIKSTVLA